MSEERKKVSTEQLRILVEEIEKDSTLLNGRPAGRAPTKTKQGYTEKWENLTKKLNSVENGTIKSVTKWQQSLRDWKSNTKRKAARIMIEKNNRMELNQELTTLEHRLLSLYDENPSSLKSGGIDISYIAEVDPLSSDDATMDDYLWNNEAESIHTPFELALPKDCVKIERENEKNQKLDQEDILKRLTALEAAQQEMEKCHSEHVTAMIAALKSHTDVAFRQSKAMEAQTQAILKLLEKKG
ncbi:uncharacterized protein LOC131841030 isoform X2 [Achroia grisella]|uniref:uncharacterized protein LOC131841030 isoform X2 n=1 Tax=Achroia grisella TaxID=688607 RepID=UPI0027D28B34|nr:uncharacterized protein LOC131841030 isoform X2 [Achroia grisella]